MAGVAQAIKSSLPDDQQSVLERLKNSFNGDHARFDAWVAGLSTEELLQLYHDPAFFLRPKQMLPKAGTWWVWSTEAGRGYGKTEQGSGNTNQIAYDNPGIRIGIMGTTLGEVYKAIIHGPSGIVTRAHPQFRPEYNEKKRELTWPNGSKAFIFTADEPEDLRSFQCHVFWIDELYKMRYQRQIWEQLPFILRLKWQPGFKTWLHPFVIITSTPRPTQLCREIRALAETGEVFLTRGNSFENAANLDQLSLRNLDKVKNTALGRQEVFGDLLDDNPQALFDLDIITASRHVFKSKDVDKDDNQLAYDLLQTMDRVVVAVDPATTDNESSDETGIIVAGRKGEDGYVFADVSIRGSPTEWAKAVSKAYAKYDADWCVYETNQGGLLVEDAIRNVNSRIKCEGVRATRGKAIRAEPVSILYEQGRIHHVGEFPELELQMIQFNPSLGKNQKSPDRMDALVWAFTKLFGDSIQPVPRLVSIRK